MNPESNEGQEEVGEAEVAAGRGKVEEGQRLTGGMKPNNRCSRQRRRTEAAKALASQLSAASGAFCREGSQAGEGGELVEGKMAVEAALPGLKALKTVEPRRLESGGTMRWRRRAE